MEIVKQNKSIFNYNPKVIAMRLTNASNKSLLEDFKDTFYAIGAYQAKNELEETHLLELSKVFIDEFKRRLNRYVGKRNMGAVEELAKITQEMLRTNTLEVQEKNEEGYIYMVNNTLRLYAVCVKTLRKMGMGQEHLKKEFL